MYQINNEKFGHFLAEVRKEKQMTQKDLADKLFVSDKTVSKWERGNSMPNVTLLIPIADVLGITVTELLQGEKLKENKTLNSDVVETLVVNSLDLSLRDTIRQRKKNWIFAFLISIGVVVIEAILLTVSGISIEQMGDSLYISLLMLLFASWLCIFEEYVNVVDEDYTINEAIEFDVYKEPKHQMQNYFDVQFYDYDPVMKLSDYNEILKLKNMDTIELSNDEYFLVTSKDLLYKVENNKDIEKIQLTSGKELKLKGIDTKTYWYQINNTGRFAVIVPDEYVQGLEVSEQHLIIDTVEETDTKLREKIKQDLKHRLVIVNDDGETVVQYYRLSVRGSAIEEQNTMTAMIASICLYIAFILISAVGTVLAIQSLSDSTKYKYRYQTLKRLGVNDKSLFKTIRKQLLILFGVPVIYSILASFFMLVSVNNVYKI